MALAAVSALTGRPLDGGAAVTGEMGVFGGVKPVGGVPAKIEAARKAGLTRVLTPRENALERFRDAGIRVIHVDTLEEALEQMLLPARVREEAGEEGVAPQGQLTAAGR